MRRFVGPLLFLLVSGLVVGTVFFLLILPALRKTKQDLSLVPLHSQEPAVVSKPPNTADLRFGIVSDSETDTETVTPILRAIAQDMTKEHVAFALHLGDFAHYATPEAYEAFSSFTATTGFPWHIVPGNHDLLQPDTQTGRDYDPHLFENQFGTQPEVFLEGTVLFLLMNNADNTQGFPAADLDLLARELSSARAQEAKVIVLTMHRPVHVPFAAELGYLDGTAGTADTSYRRFEQILQNAPTREKIHLYTGHIHSTFRYELAGQPVLVTGGGGSESNVTSLGLPSFPHWYLVEVRGSEVQETLKRVEL